MSLGFNMQRPLRSTNLPGSVGNGFVTRRPNATQTQRTPPLLNATRAASADPPRRVSPPSVATPVVPPAPPVSPEETHWVYGTALCDVHEEGGGPLVASQGTRLLLVYPQRHDESTGRVCMRVKTADAATGQLSYAWVEVFSGNETDIRRVGDFSLVP